MATVVNVQFRIGYLEYYGGRGYIFYGKRLMPYAQTYEMPSWLLNQ